MGSNGDRFHGLEISLRAFSGARAVRVVHPGSQAIDEHRHDWPFLSLHAIGAYREIYDGGEAWIAGPAAVLHPAGRPHADCIDAAGLETVSVEFDPAWLKRSGYALRLDRSLCWRGGPVAAAARRLGQAWVDGAASEAALATATATFLGLALSTTCVSHPVWLDQVEEELARETPPTTAALARRLDLNPAWLARAYRAAAGEGLQDASRRRRVERAVTLLRETDAELADVAIASHFCDQSHMHRAFKTLLGRTPTTVRLERQELLNVHRRDDRPAIGPS